MLLHGSEMDARVKHEHDECLVSRDSVMVGAVFELNRTPVDSCRQSERALMLERHHAADALAGVHQFEGVVDLFQRPPP